MTLTINLKTFVEELYVAINSGNEEDVKDLDDKFSHYHRTHSKEVFDKSMKYITNLKFYQQDKKVKEYFSKFPM